MTHSKRSDTRAGREIFSRWPRSLEIFAAGQRPLKFTAYDGSTAGPDDGRRRPRSEDARGTTYLATAPGELGFALRLRSR